jgi:hypothetical protein
VPINAEKLKYVGVAKIDDGEQIANVQRDELTVDPDLIAGFIAAVVIFAKTPVRTIRKAAYDIMIEVGESSLIYVVADPVPDEAPYRKQMKTVLRFVEAFSLKGTKPSVICNIASQVQQDGDSWMQIHLVQCLLSSLGLSWLGFLDGNPHEHLNYILPRVGQRKGRHEIQEYVSQKICEQIDNGGTTIGFDIEKMIRHSHFVVRMSKVLEKRQREINQARVAIDGNLVNLKELWLTAYGYSVLSAVNVGTSCSIETFAKIEEELKKNAFTIKTTSDVQSNLLSGTTPAMKRCIWEIADFRANSSPTIISKLLERYIEQIMV